MAAIRFDYDSALARLKERTLRRLGGKGLILFSTNSALLEACAEEFDDLAMYDEFLTRECVWGTARGKSSIMRQAGFLNYRPHRKIGATGEVKISASKTLDGSHPRDISIPALTSVSGGGVGFLTKRAATLNAGANFVVVPVIQGERAVRVVEVTQAAFPDLNCAAIKVEDGGVENSLYSVRVNGAEWREVDDIRLAAREDDPASARVYAIRTLPDFAGVSLRFGDGSLGKRLEHGDVVEFTYARTLGGKGDVLSAGIVKSVDDKLKDDMGSEVELFCANESALAGGQDEESLDSIRVNAPRSFGASDRAITTGDYVALLFRGGFADRICVWGEKELNEDAGNPPGTYVAAHENLVYITGYTIGADAATRVPMGFPIGDGVQRAIREYLRDRKGATDILQFEDTQIIYVSFDATVYVGDPSVALGDAERSARDALLAAYSIEGSEYRKSLYRSDYIAVIDGAKGVDHCVCGGLVLSVIVDFIDAYAIDKETWLGAKDIVPESVGVFVRDESLGAKAEWFEVARDNGKGGFDGLAIDVNDAKKGKYETGGAEINYKSGVVEDFAVAGGMGAPFVNYRLRIDFKTEDDGNVILTKRRQILAYYSASVRAERMD